MLQATIVEIMESWPLGLRVRLAGEPEDLFVDLGKGCRISSRGRSLAPGDLRPGMEIRFRDPERPLESLEVLD